MGVLADLLNRKIQDKISDQTSQADIVSRMAERAGIQPSTVNQILNSDIQCPPLARLRGFAGALDVSLSQLRSAAEEDGCSSINDNFSIISLRANDYVARQESLNGNDYLVVPTAMLVEGVHVANNGALYYSPAEFGKIPEAWNGIPVTIYHPQNDDGEFISANSPIVYKFQTIGIIFNTFLNENNKLMSECWIDIDKTSLLSPAVLDHIRAGKPLEVSTGVFTENDGVPGSWNGEDYASTASNFRPDHLALLPGGEGACSWDDGCGIRANQKGGNVEPKELLKIFKIISGEGFSIIQVNQVGFQEISGKIQTKLDNMDTDIRIHFLEEVFETDFIFAVRMNLPGGGGTELFRRTYIINEDGSIEFTGEPTPVIRNIEFVDANSKKEGVISMEPKEKKKPCCPEQIKLIVQSKLTRFEEKDKDYLETLSEERIIQLLPIEPVPAPAANSIDNRDQAIQVLREELKDNDKFMNLLSPEVRAQFQHGQQLVKKERNKLVEDIIGNCNKVYTADDLKLMPLESLQTMAKALVRPDYTGFGSGSAPVGKERAKLLPAGVKPAEQK